MHLFNINNKNGKISQKQLGKIKNNLNKKSLNK